MIYALLTLIVTVAVVVLSRATGVSMLRLGVAVVLAMISVIVVGTL